MIVVATTAELQAPARRRLDAAGLVDAGTLAPGGTRRLVLGAGADPWRTERVVAELRRDGWIAVERPDGGPRLDRWYDETRPVVVNGRLSVCVAWSEHDRTALPGLVELGLGGFGNGDHPTTRLLLDELARRIVGRETVLDVGCGSGVLGLGALRLGAGRVVAMDIKADAVEASRRNAVLNGVGDLLEATVAPLTSLEAPFDIVLANIARAATVELAPDLVRLVAVGGWLAVSGISPSQCDQVAAFLRPLVELDRRTSGEWSSLLLTRAV